MKPNIRQGIKRLWTLIVVLVLVAWVAFWSRTSLENILTAVADIEGRPIWPKGPTIAVASFIIAVPVYGVARLVVWVIDGFRGSGSTSS